jgi:hypothetical protein
MIAAGHAPILGVLFSPCVWHARHQNYDAATQEKREVLLSTLLREDRKYILNKMGVFLETGMPAGHIPN